jgi:hypothetical protein
MIPIIGKVTVTLSVIPADDAGPEELEVIEVETGAGVTLKLLELDELSVGNEPMLDWLRDNAE